MKTYKRYCPSCHAKLDGFTGITSKEAVPKEGDISVCAYCAQPLLLRGEAWTKLKGTGLLRAMRDKSFKLALDVVKSVRKERET